MRRRVVEPPPDEPRPAPIVTEHAGHCYEITNPGPPGTMTGGRVRHTEPTGEVRLFDLEWGSTPPELVSDAAATQDALVVLASEGSTLRLRRFHLNGRLQATAVVGTSAVLWFFPVASRVAAYRGGALVAWCGEPDARDRGSLRLSWWNPGTGAVETRVLDPGVYCNTSLSVATIGNDVLVAYHAPSKELAVVRTIHLHAPFDVR